MDEEGNEYEPDPDEAYERLRDDAGEMLHEALLKRPVPEVFEAFLVGGEGTWYYKGEHHRTKLAEHILVELEGMFGVRFKCEHPPFIRAVKR